MEGKLRSFFFQFTQRMDLYDRGNNYPSKYTSNKGRSPMDKV